MNINNQRIKAVIITLRQLCITGNTYSSYFWLSYKNPAVVRGFKRNDTHILLMHSMRASSLHSHLPSEMPNHPWSLAFWCSWITIISINKANTRRRTDYGNQTLRQYFVMLYLRPPGCLSHHPINWSVETASRSCSNLSRRHPRMKQLYHGARACHLRNIQ